MPRDILSQLVLGFLGISFTLNVFFLRRLLAKVDNIGTALFNPKDGAIIRIDRLEHAAERRAFVQSAGLLNDPLSAP